MARMKLHKSTVNGDYEVYPVYELDYTQMSNLDGFGMDKTSDALTNKNYKARKFHCENARLLDVIDGNIPLLENAEGNIIPFWHRFRTQMMVNQHNCWVLDQENLNSYAAIQQGIQPPDWGVNPNYITLFQDYFTMDYDSSTWFDFPRAVFIDEAFSSSKSYYEDTKRSELRMFYTDTGTSFSVWKMSISRGAGNTLYARQYGFARYPSYPSDGTSTKAHYNLTSDSNTVIDNGFGYKYECGITSNYNDLGYWQSGSSFHDGANCPMVFVHFVENGTTDFYGVALIQLSSFTGEKDTCVPQAIVVSALDTTFWGKSIIAGGGGAGSWTNDGPISYVQGGQGSFEAPSDNHGDSSGQSAKSVASNWSANHSPFDQGYNKYLLSSPDAGAFKQMVDNLVDPDVWQGFDNKYYNPIDSIITCSMIPAYLAPSGSDIGASSVIKASKLNLTTTAVPTFNIWNKAIHIGSVDINSYSESFADYDNTAIYINLPYVGVKQLDINACMEGELSVDYLIDYLTSDITAQIWVRDRFGNYNIRYEYKGNCGKQIPLNQIVPRSTQVLGGIGQTALPIAATAAVGGIAGLGFGLLGNISSVGGPLSELRRQVLSNRGGSASNAVLRAGVAQMSMNRGVGKAFQMTGQGLSAAIASSSVAALGSSQQMTSSNANGGAVSSPVNTQCYILISRPMWSAPEDYGKRFGYPSDISGTINQSDTELGDPFTNFLSVRAILLDGMTCLPEEKVEIENLMKAGVYVSND